MSGKEACHDERRYREVQRRSIIVACAGNVKITRPQCHISEHGQHPMKDFMVLIKTNAIQARHPLGIVPGLEGCIIVILIFNVTDIAAADIAAVTWHQRACLPHPSVNQFNRSRGTRRWVIPAWRSPADVRKMCYFFHAMNLSRSGNSGCRFGFFAALCVLAIGTHAALSPETVVWVEPSVVYTLWRNRPSHASYCVWG